MSKSKARFLAELLSSDGKVIKTKSQASTIVVGDLPTIPNSKLANSSVTIAGEGLSLGASLTLDTGDITEHTNYKYYTDARAITAVSGSDLDMSGRKVLFGNMYSSTGDLPSASTYHGMFAHVHGTGKGYFAHAGSWVELANQSGLTTATTTANAALPKAGGAMTGAITTNSTFDGVDIATRDAVLTSTTTTANAALPKAGGTMTGNISHASDFTIDAGGDIILDADGGNVKIVDNGVVNLDIYKYNSNVYVDNPVANSDIIFQGLDGSISVSALRLDMAESGDAYFNADIRVLDNRMIRLGTGQEFRLYHDATNSHITSLTGQLFVGSTTSNTWIKGVEAGLTSADGSEYMVRGTTNGSLKIYHDNVIKLETNSGGVTVTGTAILGGATFVDNATAYFGTGNDLRLYHDGGNSYIKNLTGWLNIPMSQNGVTFANADFSEIVAKFMINGSCELYENGSKKLETTTTGINVTGAVSSGAITSTGILTLDTSPASNGTGDLRIIPSLNLSAGVGYAGQVLGVNIATAVHSTHNAPAVSNTWGGVTGATAIALQADDNSYGQFQVWTAPQDSSAADLLTPKFYIAGSGAATFTGTLTSGAITTNSNFNMTGGYSMYLGSTSRFSSDNNGSFGINYGTTGGTATGSLVIYNNTTATAQINRNGSASFTEISGTNYKVGSTQIVTSGRSIQNIVNYQGTGEIQINGNLQSTHVYNSGSYYVLNAAGSGWNTVVNRGTGNNFTVNSLGGFTIDGTTVISNDKNLTNINTATLSSTTNMLLTLNPTAGNYGGILYQYGGLTKGTSIYNSGMMVYGGEAGVGTSLQAGGAYGLYIHSGTRNVGIGTGTSAPSYKLQVAGTLGVSGTTTLADLIIGTQLNFNGATNSSFIGAASTVNLRYAADGYHRFDTYNGGWGERVQITDSGCHPATDNTYDLGTTLLRWRNLYTSGFLRTQSLVLETTSPISFISNSSENTYMRSVIYAHQNNTSGNFNNGMHIEMGRISDSSTAEVRAFVVGARGGQSSFKVTERAAGVTQADGDYLVKMYDLNADGFIALSPGQATPLVKTRITSYGTNYFTPAGTTATNQAMVSVGETLGAKAGVLNIRSTSGLAGGIRHRMSAGTQYLNIASTHTGSGSIPYWHIKTNAYYNNNLMFVARVHGYAYGNSGHIIDMQRSGYAYSGSSTSLVGSQFVNNGSFASATLDAYYTSAGQLCFRAYAGASSYYTGWAFDIKMQSPTGYNFDFVVVDHNLNTTSGNYYT